MLVFVITMEIDNTEDFTLFVGNLDFCVTEEILYELFLQAGPLKRVKIPIDYRTKKPHKFGFVTFKHICSVNYAISLLNGIKLFNSNLAVSKKKKKDHSTDGIGEECHSHPMLSQTFGEQSQCQDVYDMQQSYMLSQISNTGYHGEFSSSMSLNRSPERRMEMPSTSQHMKRSQSFNIHNFHSPAQNNTYNDDEHHAGHRYSNGRHDSPQSLHLRYSPVNELKRSRSYQTPKHSQKYHSQRRIVNREESSHRHHSQRNDSRRVVPHGHDVRHAPYERLHRY